MTLTPFSSFSRPLARAVVRPLFDQTARRGIFLKKGYDAERLKQVDHLVKKITFPERKAVTVGPHTVYLPKRPDQHTLDKYQNTFLTALGYEKRAHEGETISFDEACKRLRKRDKVDDEWLYRSGCTLAILNELDIISIIPNTSLIDPMIVVPPRDPDAPKG